MSDDFEVVTTEEKCAKEQRIEELEAHCALLWEHIRFGFEEALQDEDCDLYAKQSIEILKKTPPQSLAEIQSKELDELRGFAQWMTGCGYDFCQHRYFVKHRHLLTDKNS